MSLYQVSSQLAPAASKTADLPQQAVSAGANSIGGLGGAPNGTSPVGPKTQTGGVFASGPNTLKGSFAGAGTAGPGTKGTNSGSIGSGGRTAKTMALGTGGASVGSVIQGTGGSGGPIATGGASTGTKPSTAVPPAQVKVCPATGTLKEAGARNGKLIGAALAQGELHNAKYTAAAREHNFVTPENEMK